MPYKVFKMENGEHCVYKHNEAGEMMGDSLGCHPTEKEANEQMAALYAKEPGAKKAVDFDKMKHDLQRAICEVIKASMPMMAGEMMEEMMMPWIASFTSEAVVIEFGSEYWQVPYTYDESGSVTVSAQPQWTKVEPMQNWIEASKARRPALWRVKAIEDGGEWLIEVLVPYGGPNGGRDNDGDWFSTATDFWLDKIGKRPLVHYHGWDTKGIPTQPEVIGEELGYTKASEGVWFKYRLNQALDTAKAMWEAAKAGFARASSGAISHLVRPLGQHGHIDLWPIAENSIMDIRKGNMPVNSYAVALPVVKATFKAANLSLNIGDETPQQENEMPSMDEIAAFLDQREAAKAEQERIKALEAAQVERDALRTELEALKAAQVPPAGTRQITRLPNPAGDATPPPQVTVSSKWDGFSLAELGLGYQCLKAAGHTPSAELYRALHAKAVKAVDAPDFYERHKVRDKYGIIVREFSPAVSAMAVKAVKAINPMELSDSPAVKANELMYSTQSTGGDEWVPDLWTPELWDLVRNAAPVLKRFRQYEVAGESLNIPARSGRTTVYKVAESTDQADLNIGTTVNAIMTKAATSKITLTPVKGMAWIGWSQEFNETSIVPVLSALQEGLRLDLMEQIDNILISGDTDTTTNNISDNGNGSIATTWHLLMVNGLRDHALANSNKVDIGSMDVTKFLAIMGKLGTDGASAIDPEKLFWIVSPGFYRTSLALGEALTAEKTGSVGTFQNGRLVSVFGSDFFSSDQFAKTDASGYINNSAGSNTKGAGLLVRPDRWAVGFGRQIRIESPSRDLTSIVSDTQHLVASFKLDFKANGTAAAALGYNQTLVG